MNRVIAVAAGILKETYTSRDDGSSRPECGPKKLGPRLGIVISTAVAIIKIS